MLNMAYEKIILYFLSRKVLFFYLTSYYAVLLLMLIVLVDYLKKTKAMSNNLINRKLNAKFLWLYIFFLFC